MPPAGMDVDRLTPRTAPRRLTTIVRRKVTHQYTVFIEPCEEGGYFATCPSLPGCHIQGETLEETLKEMKAAISAYLDDLRAHGEPIPKPPSVTIASIGVAV